MNDESATLVRAEDPGSVENLLAGLTPALVQLAALGDDANVTRAAARSGVSQPTLSRAMARWEKDAGTALFHRAGREITLTPKGRLLAEAARTALAVLRPAVDAALGGKEPPSIAVGFLHSLGANVVGELVSSFLAVKPGILITHREGAGAALLDELESEILDVAVIAPRPGAEFGWLPIGTQNLSLIVPAHHRFAALKAIDLATTAGESYLTLDRRFATRTIADALCDEAGFTPRILLEADNPQTVRDYVAGGLGVAILASDTSVNARVVAVPIRSPLATREIGIAWSVRHRPSPLALSFREHAHILGTTYPGWADLLDH